MFAHTLLYRHDIPRVVVDGRRFYRTPSGELLPSVTTLLGAYFNKDLSEWRRRVGEQEAEMITHRAGVRGTRLHALCERYLLNEPIDLKKEMPSTIQDFVSVRGLLDQNIRRVYGIEVPLYSTTFGVAGTADLICDWNGKHTILDFKTSRKVKKEEWIKDYFVQATLYGMITNELYDRGIEQIVIMLIPQDELPILFVKDLSTFSEDVYDACIHNRPALFQRSSHHSLDCLIF